MSDPIFANHAPEYRQAGYWPRPITPRTKSCNVPGWQQPDDMLEPGDLLDWTRRYAAYGVGVLLGSPFPDGSVLAALDIDRDDYIRVAGALLGDPPVGRVGSRGIAYLVRARGEIKSRKFQVPVPGTTAGTPIGELLVAKHLCVLPPTIHPDTGHPYRWVGKALLDTDYSELPVLEE